MTKSVGLNRDWEDALRVELDLDVGNGGFSHNVDTEAEAEIKIEQSNRFPRLSELLGRVR